MVKDREKSQGATN